MNAYAKGDQVGIATGGDTVPVAIQNQQFTNPIASELPPMLLDLEERIECINEANTAEKMDVCLDERFPCNWMKDNCVDCVIDDCAWAVGECMTSCDLIADASCWAKDLYEPNMTAASICEKSEDGGAAHERVGLLQLVAAAAALLTSASAILLY